MSASAAAEPSGKRAKRGADASAAEDKGCALLQAVYAMPFPPELPSLLSLAKRLKPLAPLQAFSALGLRMVGPFEVLYKGDAAAFEKKDVALWHRSVVRPFFSLFFSLSRPPFPHSWRRPCANLSRPLSDLLCLHFIFLSRSACPFIPRLFLSTVFAPKTTVPPLSALLLDGAAAADAAPFL